MEDDLDQIWFRRSTSLTTAGLYRAHQAVSLRPRHMPANATMLSFVYTVIKGHQLTEPRARVSSIPKLCTPVKLLETKGLQKGQ